jgi:methionyl-tRNA formyltransferase
MKVTVVFSSVLAFSSIKMLAEQDGIAGLVTPFAIDEIASYANRCSTALGLPLLEGNLNDAGLAERLARIDADAVFVMTYPWKIAERVLRVPRLGFWNWHPGLLPSYRGPDPIFWQIRNREPFGGVTVHRMDAELDAGPIALQERILVDSDDTYDRHLAKLDAPFLQASRLMVEKLSSPDATVQTRPQDESLACYWQRPRASDLMILWTRQTADEICALVRACSSRYEGARSHIRDMQVRIREACVCSEGTGTVAEPGMILSAGPGEGIRVACLEGMTLRLTAAGPAGSILTAGEFAQMFCLMPGEKFRT